MRLQLPVPIIRTTRNTTFASVARRATAVSNTSPPSLASKWEVLELLLEPWSHSTATLLVTKTSSPSLASSPPPPPSPQRPHTPPSSGTGSVGWAGPTSPPQWPRPPRSSVLSSHSLLESTLMRAMNWGQRKAPLDFPFSTHRRPALRLTHRRPALRLK